MKALTIIFLALLACCSLATRHPNGNELPPLKEDPTAELQDDTSQKHRSWSSMLTIDPSKVLTTLVKRGGLFIPKSVEKDVEIMKQVFHCEKAELNVVEKRMVLHNFEIRQPGHKPSLRIGRVYLHWDHYRRPSIDIEVDDFEILVEFTNLLLTKNNWSELKEFGFPPAFETSTTPTESKKKSEPSSSDFLRINSIDLSGDASVKVLNRPLKKEMGVFSIDMDLTDQVTAEIRKVSEENKKTGRSGCTTTQLTAILQTFFNKRIRELLKQALSEVSKDPSSVGRSLSGVGKGFDDVLNKASGSIVDYAGEAGSKVMDDIGQKLSFKMKGWGFDISTEELAERRKRAREQKKNEK